MTEMTQIVVQQMKKERAWERSSNLAYLLSSAQLANHCMTWASQIPKIIKIVKHGSDKGMGGGSFQRHLNIQQAVSVEYIGALIMSETVYLTTQLHDIHRGGNMNWWL